MRVVISIAMFAAALGLTLPAPAHSEILTRCGASSGTAYYMPGGAVPSSKAGWIRDGIENGEIALSVNGQEVDIIFRDARGVQSARAQGGKVIVAGTNKQRGLVMVIILYEEVYEHFLFRIGPGGTGEVIWGSAKITDLIAKSNLLRAECRH